jgi:hypothetical protein
MDIMDSSIIMLRIVFLILHIFMIMFTTTKSQMVRTIGWLIDRINIIGINKKKIYNLVDNIYTFIFKFISLFNDTIIYREMNGTEYVHGNVLSKGKIVVSNIKNVFNSTKSKVKDNKVIKKYRLFDERVVSKYRYVNKLCLIDYLVLIINVGMVIFYVMKVR